ncbi:hypothetical protein ABT297_04230 [Dactylosporangium sp. NPDC000555]|uniref:hypothetical protein n=1 Tax=Dactylosporangium sp. NPDC000555 TaxID=3154260 RepID=UPI00331DB216
MTARYEVGELVNLEFRAVPVVRFDERHLTCALPEDGGQLVMPLDHPGLTVTRVAPREWPPQPGDIWEDARGEQWFARSHPEIDGPALAHVDAVRNSEWDAGTILDAHGPMRLAYRKGWTPGPAPAAAATESPTPEEPTIPEALRELADILEANPGLLPYVEIGAIMPDVASLLRFAEAFGVDPQESMASDGRHWRVRVGTKSGGFVISVFHIEDGASKDDLPVGGCNCEDCEDLHIEDGASKLEPAPEQP